MNIMLIHGMARTPLSMLILSYRLSQRGHHPHWFGYSATLESLQQITHRWVEFIHDNVGQGAYVCIGHSLGTVIIRHALPRLQTHQPSACFFLAPPMVACQVARFFSGVWLYQMINGEMGQLLAQPDFMARLPVPPNTTIYAGTGGPRASWFPLGNQPNDGILSVAEATGNFGLNVIEVPAMHTLIMNSNVVFADIANALACMPQRSDGTK